MESFYPRNWGQPDPEDFVRAQPSTNNDEVIDNQKFTERGIGGLGHYDYPLYGSAALQTVEVSDAG